MKVLKIVSLVFFVTILFTACSKSNDSVVTQPTDKIEGVWAGNYGFDNDNPDIFFSLNIKPNGVIEELSKSGQVKGNGNWQLNGNTLTAKYTWFPPLGTTFSISATFDKTSGKLTGTWGYDDSKTDGGLWSMTKKN